MDSRLTRPLGERRAGRSRAGGAAERGHASAAAQPAIIRRAADPDLAERLHDGPLQDLAAMTLKLAALQREAPPSLQREIAQLRELAESANGALRALLGDLAPEPVQSDLSSQLRELCAAFTAETGIICRDDLNEAHLCLDGAVSDLVYRSIRELLTNVRKHSGAKSALVSSAWGSEDDVVFSVVDDGFGISAERAGDRPALQGSGFGLWSIEHRVKSFGGRVDLESEGGLRVALALPRQVVRSAL